MIKRIKRRSSDQENERRDLQEVAHIQSVSRAPHSAQGKEIVVVYSSGLQLDVQCWLNVHGCAFRATSNATSATQSGD